MAVRTTTRRFRAAAAAAGLVALALFCGAATSPGTAGATGSPAADFQICSGTKSAVTTAGVFYQTCTVASSPGLCTQFSTKPKVVQRCTVNQSQTLPNRVNRFLGVQTVAQKGATGTLDATQVVSGSQRNTTGDNISSVAQLVAQKLAAGIDDDHNHFDDDEDGYTDEDWGHTTPTIDQKQESHQWVDLCQGGTPACTVTGMSGRNRSDVLQALHQFEFAANATVSITQSQNTEERTNECAQTPPGFFNDPFSNQCYTIQQYTTRTAPATIAARNTCPSLTAALTYANLSCLKQAYEQEQKARNTPAGNQQQHPHGGFTGGLDHNFVQDSPGAALLTSDQDESQDQYRTNAGSMTHQQYGGVRKGSGEQTSNTASRAIVDQDKFQYTGGPPAAVQTVLMELHLHTTGECVATLDVTQNGQSEHADDPDVDRSSVGEFCDEFIECGSIDFPESELAPPPGPLAVITQAIPGCFTSDDVGS